MNREVQVRICEGLGVKLPGPTRPTPDILTRDRRPTRLPPGLGSSLRAKSFTYIQQHFPQGRMIMSAQSSSATRRRTTAVEPDELVPSRYAQKVGAIDVLVISDGVLPIPAQTIAHNIEPAVRTAWLEHEFLSPEMLEWPLNVVVVRSGGRTILIDAGIGMDPGLNLPQAGRLVGRLEAAGIDLASVTDVVLTHMHMDHIGGLLIDGVKDRLRPDLRIHVAAAELKFWESPDFSRAVMPEGFPDALRRAAKRFVNDYRCV